MFQFTQIPVLPGQIIAVQELSGPRANTEWRLVALDVSGGDPSIVSELETLLAAEGTQTDVISGKIDLKRDKRKVVIEVWVTWDEQENFFDSNPGDRHYVLDHATGRLFFGDGNAGKIPPAGAAIQASMFRSGGGLAGNVAASTVTQLLGAVSGVSGVTNSRAAEGGADGEALEEFAQRAPLGIGNRGRAISLPDYENLAHEASAGVAVARAIPTLDPNGVKLAGWVTLVIIPHSQEPQPIPSFGLRQEVQSYLEGHAPGDVAQAHRIRVIGPSYLPIDVAATLAPKDVTLAGDVEQAARLALEKFLNPLYGGPGGRGWGLGRNVFLSDIALVLGETEGVDFVVELSLSVNGVLQGDQVLVPHDQIVVAGALEINLTIAA
jgi:predicted phage baseplate assembly protein